MAQELHNQWWGLHEGDMAEELAELDTALTPRESRYEGSYGEALVGYQQLAKRDPEALRRLWWEAIGQYNHRGEY